MTPILLDTGVIVALLDRSERAHARCREAVEGLRRQLVTCEAVIAESCYLLRGLPGAPQAVLANVANGNFQIPFTLTSHAAAVAAILEKYRDQGMELADACLVQMAAELGTADVLTLDADFRIWRAARGLAFRILPGPG